MNDRNCDEVLHNPAWDALRLTVERLLNNRKKPELQTVSEAKTSSKQNGGMQYTVEDTLPSNSLEFHCRNSWRRLR